MKHYLKVCALPLFVFSAIFFLSAMNNRSSADDQKPTTAKVAEVQESENTDYTEDEYYAYDAIKNETDRQKKSAKLLEFLKKYPKPTTITKSIDFEYEKLVDDLASAKNYDLLMSLAEDWMKTHAKDLHSRMHIANAADFLGNYEKCAECLEEIYKSEPSPSIAMDLFRNYVKMNNLAKQIEWSDRLFKMREFAADYNLRWDFVTKYMESKNFPKAAEYANLMLKSADLVKQPTPEQEKELIKKRRVAHFVTGFSLFEKDKCTEATAEFEKANRIEQNGDAHYFIGSCLDKKATATKIQDIAEDAMNAYAKCELLKGDNASKARERIDQIYPALHSGSDVGKKKVYIRARKELGMAEGD